VSFFISLIERWLPGPLGQRVVALLRHQGTAGTAAKGSIAALVINAIGVLVSFAVQASLTRALGPIEYGTYSVVLVGMNMALLFSKVELDIVTTRFVGAYTATRDWARLHGLLRVVPRRVFATSVAVAIVGAGLLFTLRNSTYDHSVPSALVATGLLVLTAQLRLRGAALQGFKRVAHAQVPNMVLRPALFLVIVWFMILTGLTFGPATAIAFNAAATIVAVVLSEAYLQRAMPPGVREAPVANEWSTWLRAGYSLVFISAAQLLLSDGTGVLLVAFLLGRSDTAYYAVASQMAIFVAFASTAVMFIVAPLIAELYAKQQMDTLRRFARAATTVCFIASAALLIGLAVFGKLLLGVYGAAFRGAYPAMMVLAVSHFVSASIGALAGWLMTMTGHERAAAYMIGGSGLLQIALSFPLTATFGIMGTATATLVAIVTRSLMLSIFLRRHLGILMLPALPRTLRA
jgi:O-antigen/teichoic acid export membrane protein